MLGKTFTQARCIALRRGLGQRTSSSRCSPSLVRKEVLSLQADPRSPEHGQYGFLQDLVRRVAYETLSRRDRKARHLAAADQIASRRSRARRWPRWSPPTYLAAYEAAPDADDAAEIRSARPRGARPAPASGRALARRAGRGAALLRAGGRRCPTMTASEPSCSTAPGGWPCGREPLAEARALLETRA